MSYHKHAAFNPINARHEGHCHAGHKRASPAGQEAALLRRGGCLCTRERRWHGLCAGAPEHSPSRSSGRGWRPSLRSADRRHGTRLLQQPDGAATGRALRPQYNAIAPSSVWLCSHAAADAAGLLTQDGRVAAEGIEGRSPALKGRGTPPPSWPTLCLSASPHAPCSHSRTPMHTTGHIRGPAMHRRSWPCCTHRRTCRRCTAPARPLPARPLGGAVVEGGARARPGVARRAEHLWSEQPQRQRETRGLAVLWRSRLPRTPASHTQRSRAQQGLCEASTAVHVGARPAHSPSIPSRQRRGPALYPAGTLG
jgi:hypothetical protein